MKTLLGSLTLFCSVLVLVALVQAQTPTREELSREEILRWRQTKRALALCARDQSRLRVALIDPKLGFIPENMIVTCMPILADFHTRQ